MSDEKLTDLDFFVKFLTKIWAPFEIDRDSENIILTTHFYPFTPHACGNNFVLANLPFCDEVRLKNLKLSYHFFFHPRTKNIVFSESDGGQYSGPPISLEIRDEAKDKILADYYLKLDFVEKKNE